jgi:hypothetical protein
MNGVRKSSCIDGGSIASSPIVSENDEPDVPMNSSDDDATSSSAR